MKLPPVQTLLSAHAPLTTLVGNRISLLSRIINEETPSVVHWLDSAEFSAIDGSEISAELNLGCVSNDDEQAAEIIDLCRAAVCAGVGVDTDGVTLIDVVEGTRGFEINIDDGQGSEVSLPAHTLTLTLYYRET